MQAYLVSWYSSWWTRGGGLYNGYMKITYLHWIQPGMLYISQTVKEYYTPCGPLYSNVNLVKRWISTESESDWYAPCHDLWCGLCTFIMYVTILYQNEITWYISTLRCRWCKLISGLIFQEKYIGWKPVKYELKVSKLNSLDICYS